MPECKSVECSPFSLSRGWGWGGSAELIERVKEEIKVIMYIC